MFNLNKDFVINDHTEHPLFFYDVDGVDVSGGDMADAVKMSLIGIGDFSFATAGDGKISGVHGAKAKLAVNEVINITAATGTEITCSAAVTVDTDVIISLNFETLSQEIQYGRNQLRPGVSKDYALVATASMLGTTTLAGHLLLQLHNAIVQEDALGEVPYISYVTGTGITGNQYGTQSSTGVTLSTVEIVLTAKDEHLRLKSYSVTDGSNNSSAVITTFKPTIGTAGVEGRGLAKIIQQNIRLLTDVSVRPYGTMQHELAIPGALYTEVSFTYTAPRTDMVLSPALVGPSQTSRSKWVLYFRQDGAADNGATDYNTLDADVDGIFGATNYLGRILYFLFAASDNGTLAAADVTGVAAGTLLSKTDGSLTSIITFLAA